MSKHTYLLRDERIRNNCITEIMAAPLLPKKPQMVWLSSYKSARSIQQNALYWKWISIIADHIGVTKDFMHKESAIRLLGPESYTVDGVEYTGAKSTSSLSVNEFTEYLNEVYLAGVTLGLNLPKPSYFGIDLEGR